MPYHTINRTSTASGPVLWDPESVLGLCNDHRCVGFASSQRRKCRNPIAYHNYESFDRLVSLISKTRPDADLLRPKLVSMAEYGLCLRNHQNQVHNTVEKWSALIRAEDQRQEMRRRDNSATRVSRWATSTSTRSPSPSPVRSSSTSSSRSTSLSVAESPSPTPNELLASILALLGNDDLAKLIALNTARANSNTPQPTNPSPSRVSTSDISSLHLSRSTTLSVSAPTDPPVATTPHAPTLNSSQSEPVIAAQTSTAPPEVVTSGPRTTQTPEPEATITSHNRCQRNHARRLPMNEECVICYEGDELSECDPSEVVWCRSTCGRSFHKSCFDAWRSQCILTTRSLTCSNCRADWDEECECDGCSIRHAVRMPIESGCAICTERMVADEDRVEGDEELTWCVHGCGKSVHKECFDVWKDACESALPEPRDPTCVNCRAVWKAECAH